MFVFLFKQKTAYEMRISDWSSDVCSSDLVKEEGNLVAEGAAAWGELQQRIDRIDELHARIARLEAVDIGRINHGLERLRLKTRKLELDGQLDAAAQAALDAARAEGDDEYNPLESQPLGRRAVREKVCQYE